MDDFKIKNSSYTLKIEVKIYRCRQLSFHQPEGYLQQFPMQYYDDGSYSYAIPIQMSNYDVVHDRYNSTTNGCRKTTALKNFDSFTTTKAYRGSNVIDE